MIAPDAGTRDCEDVCSLPNDELRARLVMIRREIAPHVTRREALADGLVFEFEHSSALQKTLEDLVASERECCGGLEWNLRMPSVGVLRLSIEGLAPDSALFRALGDVERESVITCPECGTRNLEVMPTDACQFFYDCPVCRARLRPHLGDCCVFCSFGSVPCPPKQAERKDGDATRSRSPVSSSCADRDLAASRMGWVVWGIPALLVLAGVAFPGGRTLLWTAGFLAAGVACIANARRCGRMHCYVTGPLFLGLSAASALVGAGALAWSWWWMLVVGAAGTLFAHLPEFVGRRYLRAPS